MLRSVTSEVIDIKVTKRQTQKGKKQKSFLDKKENGALKGKWEKKSYLWYVV